LTRFFHDFTGFFILKRLYLLKTQAFQLNLSCHLLNHVDFVSAAGLLVSNVFALGFFEVSLVEGFDFLRVIYALLQLWIAARRHQPIKKSRLSLRFNIEY
jgi:hypothetical protein